MTLFSLNQIINYSTRITCDAVSLFDFILLSSNIDIVKSRVGEYQWLQLSYCFCIISFSEILSS